MEAISKGMMGRLAALKLKKQRDAHDVFVAEGTKCVADTLGCFRLECLVATERWYNAHERPSGGRMLVASEAEMRRISSLSTRAEVLAVYHKPGYRLSERDIRSGLTLLLDDVQDPGNMGTIVRLADWFGVRQIIASGNSADAFGAKAVQASMGSIGRVRVIHSNLPELLRRFPDIPAVGLALDGENIYSADLSSPAFIVMGNEGNGISSAVSELLSCRLLIPSWPPGEPTGESLNVAMATAITLAEFRRRVH